MGNVVIVAIPEKDDYVWKISSEKVPHMTLLNLGDALSDEDVARVMGYIDHAAKTSLRRFGLSVDRRGVLGKDDADVVFFDPEAWDLEDVQKFRTFLLREDKIKTAIDLTPQFESWLPHLTLGYPTSPAKPDPREHPGVHYVNFDRIALWIEDFEGPEFELSSRAHDHELMMSSPEEGAIKHYGIKGMKWGVRRTREQRKAARVERAGAHDDHKRARELMKKRVSELSNEELAFVNNRRNLEANHAKLNPPKGARRKKKIEKHLETLGLIEKTFNATQQPVAQLFIKNAHRRTTSETAKKVLNVLIKVEKKKGH